MDTAAVTRVVAVTRAEVTAAVGTAAAEDAAAGTEATPLPTAREKGRDVRRQAAGCDDVQDDEGQADGDDPKVRGAEVEEHGAGSFRPPARSIRKAGTRNFTGSVAIGIAVSQGLWPRWDDVKLDRTGPGGNPQNASARLPTGTGRVIDQVCRVGPLPQPDRWRTISSPARLRSGAGR
jgi:hypothetical protein